VKKEAKLSARDEDEAEEGKEDADILQINCNLFEANKIRPTITQLTATNKLYYMNLY